MVPGYQTFTLHHLVMDYNGTLAKDGHLLDGVRQRLDILAKDLHLHVVTADTFGLARSQLAGVACELVILPGKEQAVAKLAHVHELGIDQVAAIGNGRNDRLMLQAAALSIAVVGDEGAATEAIQVADICVTDILAALDLLINPKRVIATLRS